MGILLVFKQQSFQDLRTELKIKLKVGMRGFYGKMPAVAGFYLWKLRLKVLLRLVLSFTTFREAVLSLHINPRLCRAAYNFR